MSENDSYKLPPLEVDVDLIRAMFKGLIDDPIILDIDKEIEELKIPEEDFKF